MPYINNIGNGRLVRVEGSVKQALEVGRTRMLFVLVMFVLSFVALSVRVVNLGIAGGAETKSVADSSSYVAEISRNDIIDRNGIILATNLKTASLYANPKVIMDAKESADELVKLFPDLDKKNLIDALSSDRGFVWVKRNLSPKEQYAVNNLGVPGLYFAEEEKRVYPHGNIASHILGMVGTSGKGLSGIEKQFEKKLSRYYDEYRKNNDKPLQLTLDIRVQDILHRELQNAFRKFNAKGAAGIVMDAKTGEIVAMVSLPDFDPNMPSKIDMDKTFNRATLGVYEMGSTFKTFTMAMAIDSGLVKINDIYDATNPIKVASYTISDFHGKNRWLTVPEIFMYSSNIGAAKMADKIGSEVQKKFLSKIDMLDSLSVEIPEKSGPIYPASWGKISTMTISYGHGIAVTPLHVASATSALVNGGTFYSPTLIKENLDKKGRRVISNETSLIMRKLLRLVVESGTGGNAEAKGYVVGGKTGTAEKAVAKRYDNKSVLASFVGAFPMNDPRYVIMTMLDDPKGIVSTNFQVTGGFTAAPVVSKVIEEIAPLLGIRPVNDNSPEIKKLLHLDYKIGEQKIASF